MDLWLKMTAQTTVEIAGQKRISRIHFYNHGTGECVSFVLNGEQELKSEGLRNMGSIFKPGEGLLPAVVEGVSGAGILADDDEFLGKDK